MRRRRNGRDHEAARMRRARGRGVRAARGAPHDCGGGLGGGRGAAARDRAGGSRGRIERRVGEAIPGERGTCGRGRLAGGHGHRVRHAADGAVVVRQGAVVVPVGGACEQAQHQHEGRRGGEPAEPAAKRCGGPVHPARIDPPASARQPECRPCRSPDLRGRAARWRVRDRPSGSPRRRRGARGPHRHRPGALDDGPLARDDARARLDRTLARRIPARPDRPLAFRKEESHELDREEGAERHRDCVQSAHFRLHSATFLRTRQANALVVASV